MDRNIHERVRMLVEATCNGNKSEFCRRIGRPAAAIKDVIGGRMTAPGYDLLYDILASDLGISPKWLMLGEGGMFSCEDSQMTTQTPAVNVENVQAVFVTNWGDVRSVVEDAVKSTLNNNRI